MRIGTRGSPLALAQAHMVRDLLAAAHPDLLPAEIVIIKTTGDKVLDRSLSEIGGKGLFTKEIEEALLDGGIDLAVHSMKDVATVLPDDLVIDCFLEREDPRDALIGAASLAALPAGARVGTASLRRGAQLKARRPDLVVESLRGNVGTRLSKIADGTFDATFLALAGLRRLGLADKATGILAPEDMLPAIAQGIIGIERRISDTRVAALLAPLNHGPSALAATCERAFLAGLDGSCRTPIAGLARPDGAGGLTFMGETLAPDGSARLAVTTSGPEADAFAIGAEAARILLDRGAAALLGRG
ncbi:hydroxymethylbilane synthase [Zavarzinia aquatilis]|uniref:hydroxymethylbilane synthase n=1 Tax=Zavarzinia aquatilis TaxID=2211142 RepID=UPI002435A4DF|nr:hydroxymethylbilane synthase [Zavarzinia aquatilis]